jgi:hypothetical protein
MERLQLITLTLDAWVCFPTACAACLPAWAAWEVDMAAATAGAVAAKMIAVAVATVFRLSFTVAYLR